ncbi:NUDIX hydrolase [Sphingobacteriales bacterium UPWRP_1]|nr:NUDIX hydrolase [Sphingobacteriales bacterium TSM_CSS]PSJ76282.1 NUDIX hydrolase [Sphingobacteriales bacterium UPWRP_1]
MNYCSHCGAVVQLIHLPNDNLPRFVCTACATIHYQNPKMVTGCLVYWQDKVLLCKRAIEPCKGLWNIPAGYLENGETAEMGAVREVWEESSATVTVQGLHCLYSIPRINQVYLIFLATLAAPQFSSTTESSEVALFSENEINWNEIAFTSSIFALQHFFSDLRSGKSQVHIGSFT